MKQIKTARKILGIVLIVGILTTFPACAHLKPDISNSSYLQTVKSQFVETEYGRIHYIKKGEGKDPIILVHGGCLWLYTFRYNIDKLAEKFTVYAFDFPGSGYSTYTEKMRFDFDGYSQAILVFMDSQHIKSAHLVGDCWGGRWALYFSTQHPERVKNIVIAGTSAHPKYELPSFSLFRIPIVGDLLLLLFNRDNMVKYLKECYYNKNVIDESDIDEFAYPLFSNGTLKMQLNTVRHTKVSKLTKLLNKVEKKTLIIWGKNDEINDIRSAYDLDRDLPASELLMLEKTGHNVFDDSPKRVNESIIKFCS